MIRRIIRNGREQCCIIGSFPDLEVPQEVLDMLSAFGFNQKPREYSFGSGSFKEFRIQDYLPKSELAKLSEMALNIDPESPTLLRKDRQLLEKRLTEPIAEMLSKETTLDTGKFNIHSVNGSTRSAIRHILDNLTKSGKSVAVPLPNWYFWDTNYGLSNSYPYSYFQALNEDQVVSGFTKLAKKGRIGSFILSNPMTPLGYEISREAAKEIDTVALKHGVSIVVDDVLRGTREIGGRDTLASVITNPYIAEGFGHRFGSDNPVGRLSYVMIPKEARNITIPEYQGSHKIPVLAPFFKLTLDHVTVPALEELRKRNTEFDAGFKETAPEDVQLHRLYPTSITSLLTLPNKSIWSPDAGDLSRNAAYHNLFVPSMELFHPDGYNIPQGLRHNLRVSIGEIPSDEMRESARFFGTLLKEYNL